VTIAASNAMIPITTRSSTSVKAERWAEGIPALPLRAFMEAGAVPALPLRAFMGREREAVPALTLRAFTETGGVPALPLRAFIRMVSIVGLTKDR
jgi:hypothetical protein